MKTFLLYCLCLFAVPTLQAQTSTLATVEENGTRGTRLNLVFLSKVTPVVRWAPVADVNAAVTFLFTREPRSRSPLLLQHLPHRDRLESVGNG